MSEPISSADLAPGTLAKVSKYLLGPTIGQGTFGKVKQCKDSTTGEILAMKIIGKEKVMKYHMIEQLKREISLMKRLKHENIIRMHEVLASQSKVFIVLEYANGGELFQKIASSTRFDEQTSRFYFQQLIRGVHFCHQNGICHRDLKPENLLLDDAGVLKITDFGLCALSDAENVLLKTQCGTPHYTAPEILQGGQYEGKQADVWSCGIILFVMMAGYLPFEESNTLELFKVIKKAQFQYPPFFPDGPRDLINKILVSDPNKRCTMEEILSDPWFTQGLPDLFFDPSFSIRDQMLKRKEPKPAHPPKHRHTQSFSDKLSISPRTQTVPSPIIAPLPPPSPSSPKPSTPKHSPQKVPVPPPSQPFMPIMPSTAIQSQFESSHDIPHIIRRIKEAFESEDAIIVNEGYQDISPATLTPSPQLYFLSVSYPRQLNPLSFKILIIPSVNVKTNTVQFKRGKGSVITFLQVFQHIQGKLSDIHTPENPFLSKPKQQTNDSTKQSHHFHRFSFGDLPHITAGTVPAGASHQSPPTPCSPNRRFEGEDCHATMFNTSSLPSPTFPNVPSPIRHNRSKSVATAGQTRSPLSVRFVLDESAEDDAAAPLPVLPKRQTVHRTVYSVDMSIPIRAGTVDSLAKTSH
ncbi:putative CBL-interacting protein kinase 23 [Blattamonas nauphoetae]|uniref:non-specific serine/threonine protein kinase n=1 Tax=Blattamonas nauphoetae TaxID=2049346 RepID=A0ABQ9XYK1_9EUKA|nr:putative CBL-interacting protein kinase 23 [Blattamonas nauphoetae]